MAFEKLILILKNFLGHGLAIAFGLSFSMLAVRYMSQVDFGYVRYSMAVLPILISVCLPGFDPLVLRGAVSGRRINLFQIGLVRFSVAVFGALVLIGLFPLIWRDVPSEQIWYLLVTIAVLPLFDTFSSYKNYLIGVGLVDRAVTYAVFGRVAQVCILYLGFVICFFWKTSSIFVYFIYLVALLFPNLCFGGYFAFRHRGRAMGYLAFLKSFGPSGLYMTLSGFLSTFSGSLDKLVFFHYFGSEEMAKYSILMLFPIEMAKLIDSTFPLFYRRLFLDRDVRFGYVWLILLFCVTFGVLYASLFYAFSVDVFGESYQYKMHSVALSVAVLISSVAEFYVFQYCYSMLGTRGAFIFGGASLFAGALIYCGIGLHVSANHFVALVFVKQVFVSAGLYFSTKRYFQEAL